MFSYFDNVFSKNESGFRQGLCVQYCLISMIGKCDLPKAFDCLLLELIIVKLNGYMILACHLHVTDTQLFTELEAKSRDKFCL